VEDQGGSLAAEERTGLLAIGPSAPGHAARGRWLASAAMVRAIAQSHGGDLSVEERPAGGARYVLTLPVSGSGAGALPASGQGEPEAGGAHSFRVHRDVLSLP
jgi:sensor histidine kinase regulating citrate/malate metabolism